MKPAKSLPLLSLAVLLSALPALSSAAETTASPSSRVTVKYEKPEDFTDMKDGYYGTEKGMLSYQEEFSRYIQRTADHYLPGGQTLEITFTDVDMAGDFEPWRGAQTSDVRIVKAIYPPRLAFNYVVRDAAGAVVKEGSEKLSDLSFQSSIGIKRGDTFYYEQELIKSWLRQLRA